jgi:aspartate kinase
MKVFKFGGASVKDAAAIRNVAKIMSLFPDEEILVVLSAIGKTTNKLEEIHQAYQSKDKLAFLKSVTELEKFHVDLVDELFNTNSNPIYTTIALIFDNLRAKFNSPHSQNFSLEYDQIVSLGEVISSNILSAYLSENNFTAMWIDARELVKTDSHFQEANVDWGKTEIAISSKILLKFKEKKVLITQGFIGGTVDGKTTTLGREGSDYSAAIFAYCCNAENVTIWKDVPGMLNADPKYFENTKKLDSISYKEALELSYYGASVIHPKTIKPLQNKGIPLYVKSFLEPLNEGTTIHSNKENDKLIASFIVKHNQVLFSFTPNDFSFIVEENLSTLFRGLSACSAKINLMQNSALSFSILLDELKINKEKILEYFKKEYNIKYNEGLELITIRHYNEQIISKMTKGKVILVEQKTRETARFVVKNKL